MIHMSKIHVLDTHLTNMIAAGEVVERPGGIVKELVENAIDAMATTIDIKIIEGGMQLVEVSDNGEGMSADDLSRAFERHSTSKISDTDDLNAILTFGFRGEALPSISSVSQVEATTNNGDTGHRIFIDNGKKRDVVRFARNKGTTIHVRNLFLKTPARLKYIKNIHYENSIIQDTVQKFALGRPDIAFSLTLDDRMVFRSYGTGDVMDVFHRIYGGTITEDSRRFEASNYDFKIEGVAALPQHNRSNRYAIWLYINDRMIRYPKAQKAVVDSFRRHMPTDRYPIVVMKITVDPQLVDVNVHPSKWEIRLSKEDQLVSLIQNHLEALLSEGMRPQKITIKPSLPEQTDMRDALQNAIIETQKEIYIEENVVKNTILSSTFDDESEVTSEPVNITDMPVIDTPIFTHDYRVEEKETAFIPQTPYPSEPKPIEVLIEPLTVLSQLSGKYILAQGDAGLYIIDQHAAMERVRYEYYQDKLLNKDVPMQDFLIPMIIEGRQKLIGQINAINEVFRPFQMQLEVFGDDAFVLRAVPVWIDEAEVHEFVNEVLDMFETDKVVREEDMRRNVIATLACHSSVRFNEFMSMEAMETLVEQLRHTQQPFHCPHGRPTFITVEHNQLIKEFKR